MEKHKVTFEGQEHTGRLKWLNREFLGGIEPPTSTAWSCDHVFDKSVAWLQQLRIPLLLDQQEGTVQKTACTAFNPWTCHTPSQIICELGRKCGPVKFDFDLSLR